MDADAKPGGDLFITVAEGQVVLRKGGADFYHAATGTNRTFQVGSGELHALGNVNGANRARIYTTTILPSGSSLTTNQAGAPIPSPAPTVVMTTREATPPLPPSISVVQTVWDLEPGAATAPHTHHGFLFSKVVDGEMGRLLLSTGR